MALTERQQEIKKLQDEGLTPTEIGKRLGITTNGVYQQLRRMKKGGGKSTAKRTPARKTTVKPTLPTGVRAEPATVTPLQAIRARRSALESVVKDAERARDAAAKDAAHAETALLAARDRVVVEIAQLNSAEAALTGRKPTANAAKARPARKRPSRAAAKKASGSKSASVAAGSNGTGSTASISSVA